MNRFVLIRISICILFAGALLYLYLDRQNEITSLRLRLPHLERSVHEVNQEITRLRFEVDRMQDPAELLELSRQPQYRHLRHPRADDIIEISCAHD